MATIEPTTAQTQEATQSHAHTSKRGRWLAWFTWVLYLALAFATLILEFANDPSLLLPNILNALILLAFATVGVLIASRHSENLIGWLLCVGALLYAAGTLALQYAIYALVTNPGALPDGDWAGVLGGSLRGLGFSILLTYVLLLFPDGHLPSARWRPAVWFALATQAFFILAVWLAPGIGVDTPIKFIRGPLRVPIDPSTLEGLASVIYVAGLISVVVCGVSVFSRFRRAHGDERQQLKWFAYAALVAIVMVTSILTLKPVFNTNPQFLNSLLFLLAAVGIPIATGMAILKYRLYDIDLLINRTLVYVPLTAIVAGVFAASITLSQKLFVALTGEQSDAAIVLTTLIIVALIDPLKTRLQAFVDKRFKEAPDPTKRLNEFGEQLQTVLQVLDAKETARRFLEEAISAFDANGGAVYLQAGGKTEMIYRTEKWNGESRLDVPLQMDGKNYGAIELGARRNGQAYSPQDRAALEKDALLVARALVIAWAIKRYELPEEVRRG